MSGIEEMSELRTLLLKRRHTLSQTTQATRREALGLQELRDSEYEETAQVDLAHSTLAHLLETQRRELEQIDAALQRMEQNVFGRCVDCGAPIPWERLRVLPYAIRCEEDAYHYERDRRLEASAPTL